MYPISPHLSATGSSTKVDEGGETLFLTSGLAHGTIPAEEVPVLIRRTQVFVFATFLLSACSDIGGNIIVLFPDEDPLASPCEVLTGTEGEFIAQDSIVHANRAHCAQGIHATAGAKGSTLRLSLESWDSKTAARLTITDLLGQPLAELEDGGSGSWLQVQLDRSGEYLVQVEPTDPEAAANDYSLSTTCVDACGEYSRYPIVFFHGMAGTDTFVGTLDYWWGVEPVLSEAGYLNRMPPGGALAEPSQRAQQFSAALDAMEEEGIGRRFNLIGHSQGGIDARYLIGTMEQGQRIASLTTIASPHRGSPFADIAAGTVFSVPGFNHLIDAALSEFTEMLGLGPGELAEATRAITTAAMEEFNAVVPDSEHTAYYSWSGRTCGYTEWTCQANYNGEIVAPMFWASYRLVSALGGPNDGLIPIESAQWGEHLGTLPADHLDEVGLLFGESESFDHLAFYLSEARRLADEGF